MRVSREQAAENRERILEIASRLFRERGFDGIGVADLMKAAGLTHGGFYGHFASKEDLMAQACERALQDSLPKMQERVARAPDNPLAAVAAHYLSTAHCDKPGEGCALAALASESARHNPPVRRVLTEGLRRLVDFLTPLVPGRSKSARREKALAACASMVGAVVLARAVDDRDLAEEILQSVSAAIAGRGLQEP